MLDFLSLRNFVEMKIAEQSSIEKNNKKQKKIKIYEVTKPITLFYNTIWHETMCFKN